MSLVLYEKREKVACITLNRPEKKNALSYELLDELVAAWKRFRDDDDVWVAVLSGNGGSFCGGADVQGIRDSFKGGGTPGSERSFSLIGAPTTYDIWKPIIAAVHGHVIGAGLWISMCCDLRIASEDARFGFPEPRMGLPTTTAAPTLYHMHPTIANEILLTGDLIDAERALQALLINRMVPRENVLSEAMTLAQRLCQNGPLALRAIKEALIRGRDLDYAGKMALSEQIFEPVRNSRDTAHAVEAFLEKRRPTWEGR